MQRPKKAYNSRFKPYEGKKPTDKHLRLTQDMLMNENFLSISASAITLYCYMKLWASGQETFKYSISMAKILMSAPTFEKAKKELTDNGFIEQLNFFDARDNRKTGEFIFSSKWAKE